MQLMTRELAQTMPALGTTQQVTDPLVQAKFFYPDAPWNWFAIEYDGEDLCYGFVEGNFPELGYFSLKALMQNRGWLGLPIERDCYFQPSHLSQIRDEVAF